MVLDETLETQPRSVRSAFLSSQQPKWEWLNITLPSRVTDARYNESCDPRTHEFTTKNRRPKDGRWFLHSWVAWARMAMIAAEYSYAFVCIPGLPVALIGLWNWNDFDEHLVAGTTEIGKRRDPTLGIAGPALIDVSLPPRSSKISKVFMRAKLYEAARIAGIPMPWSTKVQFLIAIGQALQGVLSAIIMGVLSHVSLLNGRNNFTEAIEKDTMLMFRASIWFPKYLLLTRLWIIYVTIGRLIGTLDDGNSSNWEHYPWGDCGAHCLIKLITWFRTWVLPLTGMAVLVFSPQESVGLFCNVGIVLAFLLAVCKLLNYEIKYHGTFLILGIISLFAGLALSEWFWRQWTPDIDMCVLDRMVFIPRFNMLLLTELLDSTSLLTYVLFIIFFLMFGLLAKCLWAVVPSSLVDVDGLFHALWIIRSYTELEEQEQKELRRSMLYALGALWDRTCAAAAAAADADAEEKKRAVLRIVRSARSSANPNCLVALVLRIVKYEKPSANPNLLVGDLSDTAAASRHEEMIRLGTLLWWRHGLGEPARYITTQTAFEATEFKKGGFNATELKDADLTTQLKSAGFSLANLQEAQFCPNDMRVAGFDAGELKEELGFDAQRLKEANYTADDLKKAYFEARELLDVGFSVGALKSAGFTASELKAAGIRAAELRHEGFSIPSLQTARFTEREIREAGFSAGELREAGLRPAEA